MEKHDLHMLVSHGFCTSMLAYPRVSIVFLVPTESNNMINGDIDVFTCFRWMNITRTHIQGLPCFFLHICRKWPMEIDDLPTHTYIYIDTYLPMKHRDCPYVKLT